MRLADWSTPPLPPEQLRRLVCHDDSLFDIKIDELVFTNIPEANYESVLDFGCGCGRIARQLLCQNPKPASYIGIDIHRGMIKWCRDNLTPLDVNFRFIHHDVWNLGLGPDNSRKETEPFPAKDRSVTLAIAHSVFTHLYKQQTEFYLAEISRVLSADGIARTTWFFFDKLTFPMMQDFQVCLYVNEVDPTNAVIYDWRWFLEAIDKAGLYASAVTPPPMRGFQWEVLLRLKKDDSASAFPDDEAVLQALSGSGHSVMAKDKPLDASPLRTGAASSSPEPVVNDRPAPYRLPFPSAISREEFQSATKQLEWWYHSYYFDNGFEVQGDYDIGADVAGYGFPDSMKSMNVLDIGTGAGWFAHYFESKGASVWTVDARGYNDFDYYGRYDYPPIASSREPDRTDEDNRPIYYSPVSKAFWVMKDLLGSKIRFRNARVYDVSPELFDGQQFDLVFLGAILCHLRDPIGALMAARSVCRGRVIASTPVVIGEPEADTLPRQYLPYTDVDKISWWLPNEACFRHWFLAAGFVEADISRQVQLRCDIPRYEGDRALNGDQLLRVGHARIPG